MVSSTVSGTPDALRERMKHIKRQGTRNVGPTIELSDEFKHQNYTETIRRMYANGLVSKTKAKEMLANVENLFGEGTE